MSSFFYYKNRLQTLSISFSWLLILVFFSFLINEQANFIESKECIREKNLSCFYDPATFLKIHSALSSYGWLIIPLILISFFSIKQAIKIKEAKKDIQLLKDKANLIEKLKSDFLSQISHEVRTPLHLMMNYTAMIKDECERSNLINNENIDHYFKVIDQSSKRMLRTIDQIIHMAQLQSKTFVLQPAKIDIYSQIILEVFNEYLSLAEKQGLTFDIIKETENTTCVADEFSLLQIISNLVHNGIKFTPSGSVLVKITRNSENKLVVKIIDTGIGISEEYLPRLFNSFSQEQQGYSRQYEGTGLGMALVYQYCQINNIHIDVETKKNSGTTFTLTFNG